MEAQAMLPRVERYESAFIKAERNLETIGFFTPSNNSIKEQKEKVIRFRRRIGGKLNKLTITIIPSSKYGLPNTKHQDLYRAFQKILTDRIREDGKVPRKISFSSSELLSDMGLSRQMMHGRVYREVDEWLNVMRLTGIEAKEEGVIWEAKERRWVRRLVTVFDDVVSAGTELEDGTVADRHHVWLSQWQYDNINEHYLLSLNYELYRRLSRNTSKALFSVLHSWFYVGNGRYTKQYSELCQWLGLKERRYVSLVKQQLDPAHEELRREGFLEKWEYGEGGKGIEVTWYAGRQYVEDKKLLEGRRNGQAEEMESTDGAGELVAYFHRCMGRAKRRATSKERKRAEELIGEHGVEAVRYVVDYAIGEAKKTGFEMRDFGAVGLYLEEGLGKHQRKSADKAKQEMEQERRKAVAEKEAAKLVRRLYDQIGMEQCRAKRGDLEKAKDMIERSGLECAESLIDCVVRDAKEMGVEMTNFGHIDEVMGRAAELR